MVRIFCYGRVWKGWLVIWNCVQPAWIKTWWRCKWIDSVNHALLKWQMKMENWPREGILLIFGYQSFLVQFLSNICFCFQSLQRDMVHLRIFKLGCFIEQWKFRIRMTENHRKRRKTMISRRIRNLKTWIAPRTF